MAKNQLPELVFVTFPGMGHLLPMIQIAERVIARISNRVSAVVIVVKSPYPDDKVNTYIKSLIKSDQPFTLLEPPALDHHDACHAFSHFPGAYIEAYKPIIVQTLNERYGSVSDANQRGGWPSRRRLSGLILDMFGTCLIDVANEFRVPSYVFFTPNASTLIQAFHMEALQEKATSDDRFEEIVMNMPGFKNPYPKKYWHQILLEENGIKAIVNHAKSLRRANGILVNTFMELESSIIEAWLSSDERKHPDGQIPSIYTVGPVLTLEDSSVDDYKKNQLIKWLDSQPPSSVVFLCFGSEGCFNQDQVKEIARGLERSGQRFLWSLRLINPNRRNKSDDACTNQLTQSENEDFSKVLPEGFLDRTGMIGKVIGWAPQVAVLGHKAVGAFVSHCGWNSTLESLWFGIPILTWPMYAEQQMNAFMLVKEMGLAVEVRMDYSYNTRNGTANMVVGAEEVEKAITKMMEEEDGEKVRQNVKKVSDIAKKTLSQAYLGSSYESMGRFLKDLLVDYD